MPTGVLAPASEQDWTARPLHAASQDHLWDCHARNLSPSTIRLYGIYERAFLEWCDAQQLEPAIATLNVRNVQLCAEQIGNRGIGKRDGTWARRTFVRTMKVWMAWMADQGITEADFLSRLKAPKTVTIARRPLELWEQQALRGALRETQTGIRDLAVFALLLATGLRIGELVGLTLTNLDMTSYRVTVMGKGGHQRVVPFASATRGGGPAASHLREYLRTRRANANATPAQQQRVFLTIDGWPLTDSTYRRAFSKACRRAGVQDTEVHRTRHTFATHYLVAHPGEVDGLRYLLGHLSDDTYRVYAGAAGQILAARHRHSVVDEWDEPDDPAPPVSARAARSSLPSPAPGRRLAGGTALLEPPDASELIATVQANPALARALLQALRGLA